GLREAARNPPGTLVQRPTTAMRRRWLVQPPVSARGRTTERCSASLPATSRLARRRTPSAPTVGHTPGAGPVSRRRPESIPAPSRPIAAEAPAVSAAIAASSESAGREVLSLVAGLLLARGFVRARSRRIAHVDRWTLR